MAMAESGNIEKIEAVRELLKASIEKSKQVTSSLDETGSRLQEINGRVSSLEAEVGQILMRKSTYVAVRNKIDCVIGPAAAVLRVYNAVCELDRSLSSSDPRTDLFTYLSVMKKLEEGLGFLASNCGLAIKWLEDILEPLESNAVVANEKYLLKLKKSLRILEELYETERRARLDGGSFAAALDKLETEFRKLLTESTDPLSLVGDEARITPLLFPASVIKKLQIIIERLKANDRLRKCISMFVEVRVANARRGLQSLDLDYLDMQISEIDDMQCVENYIEQWGKHLELAVKHLFESEYELCNDVFEKTEPNVKMGCFAKIAMESGIASFLRFGKEITYMMKDPIKLLKLLDMFKVLNNLRLDFNRLFGNAACSEIQALTRDLIKAVVDGACDIFWELPVQVGSQRRFSPPPDGSVPRLVRFVTDYCNQLLGDDYRPTLTEVLAIHKRWKQETYEEELVSNQLYNIMKEIAQNLDAWSTVYVDISLSYLFMMNNHCHFFNFKGTKLGDIMGDSWLAAHEQYKDYYAALYLKESWGKILPLLGQKGLISIPVAGEAEQDFDKKRLKAFNDAFDERYAKHSNWVISDETLRQKVCHLLVQAVVPAYRSYLQSYRVLVEQDASAAKYVKHSAQSLENKLSSLFQPKAKLRKYCSNKNARLIGKIKNVFCNQFRITLTAL